MKSLGIVNILSESFDSCGTGFFISPNGYILTCNHVLIRGGYVELGERVSFKYANDSSLYEAIWIKRNVEEDLAILYTKEINMGYLPLFIHDTTGVLADTYGFPSGSEIDIKTTVSIDRISDDEKRIQLGNANTVTFGFSGAPLIYNDVVIGMISYVAVTDSNGHMNELAFAISSKCVLQSFSKYVSYKETCVGYGSKKNRCSNFVLSKNDIFCKECFTEEFVDSVKALYMAQNYKIHEGNGFFIGELQYGSLRYFNAVFCIVKFNETVTIEDLYSVINISEESKYNISHIIIITNANLNEESLKFVQKRGIEVLTREKLLHTLFDFESYRKDLLRHVDSEQLSVHYIEIYGTSKLNENEDIIFNDNYSEENTYSDEEHIYSDEEHFEFIYEDSYGREYFDLLDNEEQFDEEISEQDPILLKDYVDDFLLSKHKALLILGDYGSGKTSFCYTYALKLLDEFIQAKNSFLPLLVRLRGYNKAVGIGQLLTDYFVNDLGINNFNISSFKLLLKNINVIMIFDGYDEVAKKVDFDIKYDVLREICNFVEGNTKIIITCRPNYFQNASEFKRIFQNSHFAYEPGEKPLPEFIENSIAELNDDQINFYINSYQRELEVSNISVADIINAIANTHDLTDLAKRPFLLYVILKTLPEILREKDRSQLEKINAARLYSKYTDDWIKREDEKNKTLIRQEDKEMFCKELAYELYISDARSLSYKKFPDAIKKYFKNLEKIEDIDYFTHDVQSCSFLTSDRTGEFEFIHRSFMEYFVAERIVNKLAIALIQTDEDYQPIKNIDEILGSAYLSMDICLFIVEILEIESSNLINEAFDFYISINSIARSNLLSIIAKSHINMSDIFIKYKIQTNDISKVDFSHAEFENGKLRSFLFENLHFYSVKIENMVFIDCDFEGTVFKECKLINVSFFGCNFRNSSWVKTSLLDCIFCENLEGLSDGSINLLNYARKFEVRERVVMWTSFSYSNWLNSIIRKSEFISYDLNNTVMDSICICDTHFEQIDFSGTYINGNCTFENITCSNVIGEPYEF